MVLCPCLFLVLLCCGRGPKSENVVGLYTPERDSDKASVQLRPDGTFEKTNEGTPNRAGEMEIGEAPVFRYRHFA